MNYNNKINKYRYKLSNTDNKLKRDIYMKKIEYYNNKNQVGGTMLKTLQTKIGKLKELIEKLKISAAATANTGVGKIDMSSINDTLKELKEGIVDLEIDTQLENLDLTENQTNINTYKNNFVENQISEIKEVNKKNIPTDAKKTEKLTKELEEINKVYSSTIQLPKKK